MKILKEMYMINSASGNENELQIYIRKQLDSIGIEYYIDKYNQTYNLNHKHKPLVSAHADQVGTKPLRWIKESNDKIYSHDNLGADDKNGVFIVLELLKKYPNLNFILSNQEEVGGLCDKLLEQNKDKLKSIPYGLIFDRKGNGDIIGTGNQYCCEEFEQDLEAVGEDFGYKANIGVWSDADTISDYISCVNLSCGYYNAHTANEYTIKSEVINCFDFSCEIINKITKRYPAPDKTFDYYMDEWTAQEMDSFNHGCCPCCGVDFEYNLSHDCYCDNCGLDLIDFENEIYFESEDYLYD